MKKDVNRKSVIMNNGIVAKKQEKSQIPFKNLASEDGDEKNKSSPIYNFLKEQFSTYYINYRKARHCVKSNKKVKGQPSH